MMLSEVMVWKRYFLSRAGLLCTHRDILYRMSWCFKETVGRHVSFDGIMGLDFGSYWNHEPTKGIQRYTKTNLVGSLKSFVLFNDIGVATQKGFQGLVLNLPKSWTPNKESTELGRLSHLEKSCSNGTTKQKLQLFGSLQLTVLTLHVQGSPSTKIRSNCEVG